MTSEAERALRAADSDGPHAAPRAAGAGAVTARLLAFAAILCWAARAAAETPPSPEVEDRGEVTARSETYLNLFQRALFPGPAGAIIDPELSAVAHEYVYLRADRLNTPLSPEGLDFEISAWGGTDLLGTGIEPGPDGDVLIANVSHRLGPAYLRLGRQVATVGAARFSRFDGVAGGFRLKNGLGGAAYGGLTVLPRWSGRPGYHLLGASFDTLVEDPSVYEDPSRSGNWLAGGQISYAYGTIAEVAASFHEQREQDALGRRDVGLDGRITPTRSLDLVGRALIDAQTGIFSKASAIVDFYPIRSLDLALEYRRVVPALLMSRQSVLSVFAIDEFSEAGGEVNYDVTSRMRVGASAYYAVFATGDTGARQRVTLSMTPDAERRTNVELAYGRVMDVRNGYHATRAAIRYRITSPFAVTGEHNAYFYDEPIQGMRISSVEAANVEWTPILPLRVLAGASWATTPYAVSDVRGLVRLVYELHRDGGAR